MLHHFSFAVTDLERSAKFYDAALGALGHVRVWADNTAVGYGPQYGVETFAIRAQKSGMHVQGAGLHVAFSAVSRPAVDAFYDAAMKAGGTDNGGAGLHQEFGADYYAAFVIDPDGYRIEAVVAGDF